MLVTNTAYDWKEQHADTAEQLEGNFDMELHNDVNKNVPAPMDNFTTVDKAIATIVDKKSSGVDNIAELLLMDHEHEVNFHGNATVAHENNSPCISTKDDVDVKLPPV